MDLPPKIGLALGSGASRGWSHIGVIRALARAGVHPDVVCGTSVGAMIGASYVAGNLRKLEKWVLSSNRSDVLRFFALMPSQSGFVDSDKFSDFIHDYVVAEELRIEDLPKSYAAVATNLTTGAEVWFTEGAVSDAVRASMAMPGLFPAVHNERRWLVDGGLVNPVPVSLCRALGADIVIAVNLNADIVAATRKRDQDEDPDHGSEEEESLLGSLKLQVRDYSRAIFPDRGESDDAPGLFFAIANSIKIFQNGLTRSRISIDPPDVLVSPNLAHIGMLEFHRAAEAIEEGQRCMEAALPEIPPRSQ